MLCANFNHQTLKVSMSILAQIIGTFVYLFDAQIQPQINLGVVYFMFFSMGACSHFSFRVLVTPITVYIFCVLLLLWLCSFDLNIFLTFDQKKKEVRVSFLALQRTLFLLMLMLSSMARAWMLIYMVLFLLHFLTWTSSMPYSL